LKRDIVGELCDAAHRKNFKLDLYFSHPDWHDMSQNLPCKFAWGVEFTTK
jgi:alpha-L-fucosidase